MKAAGVDALTPLYIIIFRQVQDYETPRLAPFPSFSYLLTPPRLQRYFQHPYHSTRIFSSYSG